METIRKGSFYLLVVLLFSGLLHSMADAFDKESGCVKCHSDRKFLTEMGYPQMYLDPAEVDREVNMMGVPTCVDCHKGNKDTMDREEAHKDMPRPFYAAVGKKHKYQAVDRGITNYAPIQPEGKNRTNLLMRKPDKGKAKELGIKKVMQLFYHDHDPETMAYSPKTAMETCGKCHDKETKEYNITGMGLNKYQRGFTNWKKSPPGPQNCGVWWEDNYEKIRSEASRDFTKQMNSVLTRACNKCHAGCNDCHYQGFKKSEARHLFSKKVDSLSCYGSGKGTICHAGPMDRRRGAGYMREEFAFPYGVLPDDVHAETGVQCVDCHRLKGHSYGTLASEDARRSCNSCHGEIVQALQQSEHSKVDCASCHIQAVGAYQFTFWGPGITGGVNNIFTKHKQYYGVRSQPTLMRHPERGVWIPVKPYPMGVMNIKGEVEKTGLRLREIPETVIRGHIERGEPETFKVKRGAADVNDLYIITGTYKLKKNGNMLAWIQMDKMSHAIGKARECESCHSSHDQVATSWFTYNVKKDVTRPFSGSYTIKATRDGLFFSGLQYTDIVPTKKRHIEDFAPFSTVNLDAWDVKGIDFSIPFDEKKYEKKRNELNLVLAMIHNLKMKYKKKPEKLGKLKTIETILYHNVDKAKEMITMIE
jgi:hypothetical protein